MWFNVWLNHQLLGLTFVECCWNIRLPFNICSFCHKNMRTVTTFRDVVVFYRKQQQKPWLRWRGIRVSKMAAFSCWSYWLSCMCQECGSNSILMTQIARFVVGIILFITTTTTATILRLSGFCPGLPRQATSQYHKGKTRKVNPIWICWSKR